MLSSDLVGYLGVGEYRRPSSRIRARILGALVDDPRWHLQQTQPCVCACGSVRHLVCYLPGDSWFVLTVLADGQMLLERAIAGVAQ